MTKSLSNEHDFSDEIIDLEEFAKANRVPPNRCKGYRIRVDKQSYVVTQPAMKGLQILELASKTPEQYSLYERGSGGQSRPVPRWQGMAMLVTPPNRSQSLASWYRQPRDSSFDDGLLAC